MHPSSLSVGIGLGSVATSAGTHVGAIVFGGEPLTLGGEPILSGTEDDVELADALAALSGSVSMGGNIRFTSSIRVGSAANEVLIADTDNGITAAAGWGITLVGGDIHGVDDFRCATIDTTGNIDCGADLTAGNGEIAGGSLLIDGAARVDGHLILNGSPTSDDTTNHVWVDNGAAKVLKLSA